MNFLTVFGTYFHGLFDNGDFTYALLSHIAEKKGIALSEVSDIKEYREKEYDKLADLIRNNIDMKEIYRIIGI